MNIKTIYDKITHISPMEPDSFLNHLDTTVRSLIARYKPEYVCIADYTTPTRLSDEIPVRDAYMPAVVDNILFLATGDAARKTDYVEEARDAYRTVWSARMRGKKFADRGYYDV